MKRSNPRKLDLSRETLHRLDGLHLGRARGGAQAVGATLTVEPPCAETDACPPPNTGCTSTLSCTQ